MRYIPLKVLLNFLFLCLLVLPAYAQEDVDNLEGARVALIEHIQNQDIDWDNTERNVFIELHTAKSTINPGENVTIVIEQILRPHWHTYWKNPGDSGEPMHANWSLPKGFKVSELSWPTPRKLPFDPLLNYGHEGNVFLLQNITAPETLPEGAITIPVRFDILVCKEICIPESTEKNLTFNTGNSTPSQNIQSQAFVNETRSLLPTPAKSHAWKSTLREQNDNLVLTLTTNINEEGLKEHTFEFFPYEYGLVENSAEPKTTIEGNIITFNQKRGDFPLEKIKNKGGVFVLEDATNGERYGYIIDPEVDTTASEPAPIAPTPNIDSETGSTSMSSVGTPPTLMNTPGNLFYALIFALIGGVILNLMPCVFPVLSMKVLSLSKISEKSRTEAQKHGLAYTAGIVLSFLAIAGLLIVLKTGGSGIGWGFHLQNPVVILLLANLFFLIGLNLSGFFEIGSKLISIGQGQKTEGVKGSFMTGILATIVATPCTAPFMAAALGYALVQPASVSLLIFGVLGLGLALPYLLISFIPALQKIMPRPGYWMVTFKEFLAFPMYATVIWLLWILSQQVGMNSVILPLIGLLGVAFAIWLYRHTNTASAVTKTILTILALGIFAGSIFFSIYEIQTVEMAKEKPIPKFGQSYSPQSLEKALATDQAVFVEMTAAWCVTCKVNNYRAINIPKTKKIIADNNIIYLVGDWTNYDPEITSYLNKFGRNGVPIYIYYGRPDEETGTRPQPEMLPQILSPSTVAEALNG